MYKFRQIFSTSVFIQCNSIKRIFVSDGYVCTGSNRNEMLSVPLKHVMLCYAMLSATYLYATFVSVWMNDLMVDDICCYEETIDRYIYFRNPITKTRVLSLNKAAA